MFRFLIAAALVAVASVSSPRDANANGELYARGDVDKIRASFDHINSLDPDAPLAAAEKMLILRNIDALIDWVTTGTFKSADIAQELLQSPARVVPELRTPIAVQVEGQRRVISDMIHRCISEPDIECLMDSAAAAYAAEMEFAINTVSLSALLVVAHDHEMAAAYRDPLLGIVDKALDYTNFQGRVGRQKTAFLNPGLPLNLYASGYEDAAADMANRFLRDEKNAKGRYDPAMLAIYQSKRYRDGRIDLPEFEARIDGTIQDLDAQMGRARLHGYQSLILTLHTLGHEDRVPTWASSILGTLGPADGPGVMFQTLARLDYVEEAMRFLKPGFFEQQQGKSSIAFKFHGERASVAAFTGDVARAQKHAKATRAAIQKFDLTKAEDYEWLYLGSALLRLADAAMRLEEAAR